jgi:hypothetical protein
MSTPSKPTTVLLWLITFRLVYAQIVYSPTGCPAPVSIENGNFDSGLTPWSTPSADPTQPTISIVSPGYNSANALQLEFQAANVTSWWLEQDVGLQCEGSQYFTSFAVNWLNFSLRGEPDNHSNFCDLEVGSSYCYPTPGTIQYPYPGGYNASSTPGWQNHSFTCTAQKSGYATIDISVGCIASYIIPAFTCQLTNFVFELVATSVSSQSSTSSTPYSTLFQSESSSSQSRSSQPTSTQTSFSQSTSSQSSSSQTMPTPSQSSTVSLSFSSSFTPSASASQILPMSTTVPSTSPTNILTSSSTIPTTSSTSVPVQSAADRSFQALRSNSLIGLMGLVLLFPYLL